MPIEAKIAITAIIFLILAVIFTPAEKGRLFSICEYVGLFSIFVLFVDLIYWVWS